MAIYIQTPNGLYPIGGQTTSGQVTKSKIIEALGYTPSAFDGDYNSLNNRPEIIEDGSDSFYIVDTQGNIIFKVDSNGVHSVNLTIGDKTINQIIQENTPSGDYNDLVNRPEIIEDESDELSIVDSQGNIVAKITSEGIQAVNFLVGENKDEVALAKDIPTDGVGGVDGEDGADGEDGREVELIVEDGYIKWRYVGDSTWTDLVSLEDLKGDVGATGPSGTLNTTHTSALPTSSNESLAGGVSLHKVSKTGDYTDLSNKPEILEDESDELSIVDSEGNIVAKITSEGIQAVNFLVGADEVALAKDIPTGGGVDGEDGREVEFNKSTTHIQWRYVDDSTWTDLVPLSELKGDAGTGVYSSVSLGYRSNNGTVSISNIDTYKEIKAKVVWSSGDGTVNDYNSNTMWHSFTPDDVRYVASVPEPFATAATDRKVSLIIFPTIDTSTTITKIIISTNEEKTLLSISGSSSDINVFFYGINY